MNSIYEHWFEYMQQPGYLADTLVTKAKSRGIMSSLVAAWRLSGEPLVSTETEVEKLADDSILVSFFDENDDTPRDELQSPVAVLICRLHPMPNGHTLVSFSCDDDRFLAEFDRMLSLFGESRPNAEAATTQAEPEPTSEVSDVSAIEVDQAVKRQGDQPQYSGQIGKSAGILSSLKTKRRAQPTTSEPGGDEEQQEPRAGVFDRVVEMHRLLKTSDRTLSLRQAAKIARTDPRTYVKYCRDATGEEPISPYR